VLRHGPIEQGARFFDYRGNGIRGRYTLSVGDRFWIWNPRP
jgi:hypothetical protein